MTLANKANLSLSAERAKFLDRVDEFQLEGRYPERIARLPHEAEAKEMMRKVREMFEWLMSRL